MALKKFCGYKSQKILFFEEITIYYIVWMWSHTIMVVKEKTDMAGLGKIRIKKYLEDKMGIVTGQVVTDGKLRYYRNEYVYTELEDGRISISMKNEHGDSIVMPAEIELTAALVAFFWIIQRRRR